MNSKNLLICGYLFGGFSTLASAAILVTEQFETDGDSGTRYLSSAFDDGADHFNRHDYGTANPHPQHTDQTLLSVGGGSHNEWAWAMEDITDTNNPLGTAGPAVLRLNDIDTTGFINITVTISVAAIFNLDLGNDSFDAVDGLDVQYALGASSGGTGGSANPTLLNGTYATIGSFRGQGIVANPSLAPREVSSGTVLSNQLQDFTFTVPDGTGPLSIQIVGVSLDGSEEFVFDNVRIEGDAIPEPSTPLLFLAGLSLGLFKRRR